MARNVIQRAAGGTGRHMQRNPGQGLGRQSLPAGGRGTQRGRAVRGGRSGAPLPSKPDLIKFQPWLSLVGDSTSQDVIQPAREWLDGEDIATYVMKIEVLQVSNCTLVLESAPTVEGPWTTSSSVTTVGSSTAVATSEGGSTGFSKYLRWRADKGGSDWEICFKVTALPSQSTAVPVKTPRKV